MRTLRRLAFAGVVTFGLSLGGILALGAAPASADTSVCTSCVSQDLQTVEQDVQSIGVVISGLGGTVAYAAAQPPPCVDVLNHCI